jgi:hypothetical protein
MTEILLYLATQCAFLFRPDGYRFVDSRVSESFGGDAMVTLQSAAVRMCFSRDRGQLLLDLQPTARATKRWYSIGLFRGLLLGDRGSSEVLDSAWADFLRHSLAEIEARFGDPVRLDETIKGLHQQATLRGKELFG